ncbi:L-lactate dehydrogenase complex protein LldE [Azospirillum agricola]|uniref:(Fe-S)-binding protein n=1 Tax=Azospirillum agricola TaxID=1720247 RepID=UPI001AE62822|nr:(Fe-S)-binding protein [Azospirillum agricola]MBP2228438.1 L-lactate dehydrogenase complex protein LldE [Azospirillum agricola]
MTTATAPQPTPPRPSKVYFFGTCLVDLFYPEAGMAGMELLKAQGLTVVFPQGQSCCGQPAYNSGYRDEALKVARAQLDLFPEDLPIVVPSGSCAGMMRKHWPHLFHGEPDEAKAVNVSSRVWELTQFLVQVLDVRLEDKGEPMRVTWHASCHAQREMGVVEEPKALLRQLANVELVELKREKECCGFGGTFAVRHPEISAAMVGDKVADIEQTGARRVVSGDCGCLLNINGALEGGRKPVQGQHIAQFLKERLHG